ncbi:MAG: hypothetical protein JNK37_19900 [Verrucomicrobiales bacterium]|nr:hypothetical protein [Verrucomicrobiales bacterium]
MKRLWQLVTLLMLALIVPASMCCHLVEMSSSEASGCCPTHEQGGDDERNPLSCPSDSISHSQVPETVFLPAVLLAEHLILVPGAANPKDSGDLDVDRSSFLTEAPPELTPTWAFVHRASLPARAPSALA